MIRYNWTQKSARQRVLNSKCKRSGLTLIEVLLALTIFLLSFVALAGLVDMGMDRELESQFNIRAARLAQSKMGEVVSGGITLSSTSGNFTYDSDWSWNMTVGPAPMGQQNLYLVTITVSRDFKGRQFQYVLNQFVIDPLNTGSAQAATSTTDAGLTTSATAGSGSSSSTSGGQP